MSMNKENNNQVKSIRDIEISKRREEFDHRQKKSNQVNYYRRQNKKKWPLFLLLILILGAITTVSFAFHQARVEVKPNSENLIFANDAYGATVIDGEQTEIKNFNNNESQKIYEGKIKIFNKTKKSQTLRAQTRFESADGLIFKIDKAVSIPAGKNIITNVYSTGSGLKYNKKKGEKFTIPGFAEANMKIEFEKITAVADENFKISIKKDIKKEDLKTEKKAVDNNLKNLKVQAYLNYKIFEIGDRVSEEIESVGVENVSTKATGKIRIYNKTGKTQRLRKTTRFSNNNLVFRTTKSITIPAKGSAVVEVVATEAGEKFNLAKGLKFDIPGFKEAKMTNEYKNIYGMSETDFSGGKVGKILVPNKKDLAEKEKILMEKIKENLKIKLVKNEKRKNYIFLEDVQDFNFIKKTENKDGKIFLNISGFAKVPILEKEKFINLILQNEGVEQKNIDLLKTSDISKLKYQVLNKDNFSVDSGDTILFAISGEIKIYWKLDKDLLLKSIRGNTLSEVNKKLQNSFKQFEFKITTSPFWRKSIPYDLENIEIILKK